MARSSAAAVAAPPAVKRRKPATRHASSQTARRPVRRTSGPVASRGSSAAVARSVAVPRAPVRAPRAKPRTAPRTRPRSGEAPLVQRLARGRTGALIDRLLRGRACVALVFALLVGIVFLNVSLLEMNGGIATTSARATELEQQNAKLREQIAPLSSSERIQAEAVKHGYSLPAAGDVGYITGSADANAKKAVVRMTAPGLGQGVASRSAAQMQQEQAPAASTAAGTPSPVTPSPVTPITTPTPAGP
jgi:cell division protein FtsL